MLGFTFLQGVDVFSRGEIPRAIFNGSTPMRCLGCFVVPQMMWFNDIASYISTQQDHASYNIDMYSPSVLFCFVYMGAVLRPTTVADQLSL